MTDTTTIMENVSMFDVCDRYGLSVDGKGKMCCPFHNEKTPSLRVYSGNRGFYCFGCGAGSSVVDFVMMYFGIDFKTAIEKLSMDFGIDLNNDYRSRRKLEEQSRKMILERSRKKRLCTQYEQIYQNVTAYYRQCWRQLKICSRPSNEFFLLLRRVEYMDYWFVQNKAFEMWVTNR